MSLMIAVVTRRTGVTLTLRNNTHELFEVRPVHDWLARSWVEDVIVLDLETPQATLEAVEHFGVLVPGRPIVVIASDDDPWNELTALYPDLLVVPLPITASTLLDTVDRAASLARTGAPPAESHVPTAPAIQLTAPAVRPAAAPGSAAGTSPVIPQPHTEPAADDRAPRPAEPTHPTSDTGRSEASQSQQAMATTRALLREVGRLPRVADTAALILKRATQTAAADASAVLVPDDGVWRVAASEGLRPLEERLQIDASHWLIAEIAFGHRGLLIKNTDVARNQLSGAPLASWANLMAVPLSADGLMIMARERAAFTRGDLTRVAEAVAGSDDAMADALDVRRLARKMISYLDIVD